MSQNCRTLNATDITLRNDLQIVSGGALNSTHPLRGGVRQVPKFSTALTTLLIHVLYRPVIRATFTSDDISTVAMGMHSVDDDDDF